MTRWAPSLGAGLLGGLAAVALILLLTGQTRISGGGAGVPSNGLILMNGACPGGYTELVASQGRFLVAAPAAGTIGGTMGSAIADLTDASFTPAGTNGTVSFTPAGTNGTVSFTPAGTNSTPTFSGSAMAAHAHTTVIDISSPDYIQAGFGSGSATGTSNQVIFTETAGANTSVTGTLTASVSAGTPAGSVTAPTFTGSAGTVGAEVFTGTAGTVGAEVFTGTATTTMRSTVSPYIQLRVCQAP